MQSTDYVPGVSGWKIDPNSGEFELNSDKVTARGHSPNATYDSRPRPRVADKVEPFIVVDGVIYIRQAEVDEARIPKSKIASEWSVKVQLLNGRYVASGIGLGIASQSQVDADKCRIHCMCGGGPAGFEQT